MKTWHNIDEFIGEAFPLECQKIQRQQPSAIESEIKNVDANFKEALEGIVSGKAGEEKRK
jgi:hypothetical protein